MILMGDDFRYTWAPSAYASMDNMIAFINQRYPHKYHLRYSTPSDYLDAL